MKLLKFPIVVQEQILKSMDYRQLFFLSFCSSRAKILITFFKYKLVGIYFDFVEYNLVVIFQDDEGQKQTICQVSNVRDGAVSSEVLEYVEEENTSACSMIFYRKSDDSDTLLDIQEHIFDTFSKSSKLYFTVTVDNLEYYRYIPGVQKIILYKDTYEVKEVEELIRSHSELKAVIVFNDLVGEISSDSNIFDVGNLTIQYPSRPFTEFTDHYRGRFATFCTPKKDDARVFLDKWLKKECCDNLKHAIVYLSTGGQFDYSLLDNFGRKRWDIRTMPEMYPYDKNDAYFSGAWWTKFKCDGVYYTERFDGKVATIGCCENYMILSVWDQRPW